MQLNLNSFLSTAPQYNLVLISASAENEALVTYLESGYIDAMADVKKTVFMADRYFDLSQVMDIFNSASLFGDVNVVALRFKTKPTAEQAKNINTIFQLVNNENRLLIICDKLDKKDLTAKWIAELQEFGGVILNLSGDMSEARLWSKYILSSAGISIENDALEFLIEMNQNNFSELQQELNKFCFLHPKGHVINLKDAESQLTDNAQYNVFALSNAYLSGEITKALKIFHNVCSDTEDAILLMWTLGEDIRKLISIKNALRGNSNFHAAVSGLRIWGDAVAAFQKANSRLTYNQLLNLFDRLSNVDTVIKGLNSGNYISLLEQIIVNISRS